MAKILFIVNDHPNEAFSISVARETAKALRVQGHEIIWEKTPIEQTMLGRLLKGKPLDLPKRKSLASLKTAESRTWLAYRPLRRAQWQARTKGADIVYNFHCTDSNSSYWRTPGGADFRIEHTRGKGRKKTPIRLVELKAVYKEMPERIRQQVSQRAPERVMQDPNIGNYLTRTTSQELSRAAGLTPEKFAERLVPIIAKEAKVVATGKKLRVRVGRIRKEKPRAKPKARRPRP